MLDTEACDSKEKHRIRVLDRSKEFVKKEYGLSTTLFVQDLLYLQSTYSGSILTNIFEIGNDGQQLDFATHPYHPLSCQFDGNPANPIVEQSSVSKICPECASSLVLAQTTFASRHVDADIFFGVSYRCEHIFWRVTSPQVHILLWLRQKIALGVLTNLLDEGQDEIPGNFLYRFVLIYPKNRYIISKCDILYLNRKLGAYWGFLGWLLFWTELSFWAILSSL